MQYIQKYKYSIRALAVLLLLVAFFVSPLYASAAPAPEPGVPTTGGSTGIVNTAQTGDICGGPTHDPVKTSINIGCEGKGNPIMDALFAVIRFLSAGVGLVVIASIIFGGIQYTSSRGDPQATAKAIERIRSSVIALIIFIFAYALLGYLIPAGVLK
jgi:Type IV secretion system pilin